METKVELIFTNWIGIIGDSIGESTKMCNNTKKKHDLAEEGTKMEEWMLEYSLLVWLFCLICVLYFLAKWLVESRLCVQGFSLKLHVGRCAMFSLIL